MGLDLRLQVSDLLLGGGEGIGAGDEAARRLWLVRNRDERARELRRVAGLPSVQKQLRLQEARQLMLNENLDAGSAGGRVGYESPSQFSREYSRLFGAPPQRDVTRMRLAPVATASPRRAGSRSAARGAGPRHRSPRPLPVSR